MTLFSIMQKAFGGPTMDDYQVWKEVDQIESDSEEEAHQELSTRYDEQETYLLAEHQTGKKHWWQRSEE